MRNVQKPAFDCRRSVYGPASATVYLMNRREPGTTEANDIAKTLLDVTDDGNTHYYSLFEGLTLDPGDYYLIVDNRINRPGTFGAAWGVTRDPGVIQAAQIGILGPDVASDEWAPERNHYSPGNVFNFDLSQFPYEFRYILKVEGTLSPVPLPDALWLLGSAGLALAGIKLRGGHRASVHD